MGAEMMLMTIQEYAEHTGRSIYTIRNNVAMGKFKTAKLIEGKWYIDSSEILKDKRLKDGQYIGWRNRERKRRIKKED